MEVIRLADRDNYRYIEEEWKYEFIVYVLSNLGIPKEELAECLTEDYADFTLEKKLKLRKLLDDPRWKTTIVDDRDGGLKIYLTVMEEDLVDHILIGEWKKCQFNLREDHKEIDPSKKLYVEIVGNVWTILGELYED